MIHRNGKVLLAHAVGNIKRITFFLIDMNLILEYHVNQININKKHVYKTKLFTITCQFKMMNVEVYLKTLWSFEESDILNYKVSFNLRFFRFVFIISSNETESIIIMLSSIRNYNNYLEEAHVVLRRIITIQL